MPRASWLERADDVADALAALEPEALSRALNRAADQCRRRPDLPTDVCRRLGSAARAAHFGGLALQATIAPGRTA